MLFDDPFCGKDTGPIIDAENSPFRFEIRFFSSQCCRECGSSFTIKCPDLPLAGSAGPVAPPFPQQAIYVSQSIKCETFCVDLILHNNANLNLLINCGMIRFQIMKSKQSISNYLAAMLATIKGMCCRNNKINHEFESLVN